MKPAPGSIRTSLLAALVLATRAPARAASGPPFDLDAKTPHDVVFTIDTKPARDVLGLISGAPEPTAALRRLKASAHATLAIRGQNLSPDDYYGKLVSAIAGTPDPLFTSFAGRSPYFAALLDEMDASGPAAAALEARRVASILPPGTPVKARVVLVPFFAISGFADIVAVNGDGEVVLAADLPRLVGNVATAPPPREILLQILRGASAEAWRTLFESARAEAAGVAARRPTRPWTSTLSSRARSPRDPARSSSCRTSSFRSRPSSRSPSRATSARWNKAAEVLLEGKLKDTMRQDLFQTAGRGDFWQRYPSIVGAQMTDGLLRLAGREKFLAALAAGPRAVAALYVSATKGKGYPEFTKPVKKALEARPSGAAEKP